MPAKVKTRGQKQIHQENAQTILIYAMVTLVSALLVAATSTMVESSSRGQWVSDTGRL